MMRVVEALTQNRRSETEVVVHENQCEDFQTPGNELFSHWSQWGRITLIQFYMWLIEHMMFFDECQQRVAQVMIFGLLFITSK